MPSISEGQAPDVFHATLGAIFTSVISKNEPYWKGYLEEGSTDKRWYDDVEWVDPGLWTETDEGNDIDMDEYNQGYVVRWRPLKFAKRLVIPEEIIEDAAYEEAYQATEMLARTCVQTQDYYAVGIIDDAATTGVNGGDGVTLANSAHPIRGGSTVSNILSPALTPSNTALNLVVTSCVKMPGGNGYIAGQRVKKWIGPENLHARFLEILKSDKRDDTANNAINSLKPRGVASTYSPIPHMSSTTNWGAWTDAQRGARFVWRRKPRFKKESTIKNETETHTGSARFLVSWSNWRTYYFSLA
ncbi:MAG TPA: hypothetical protein VEJ18_00940 [Planctomycetota bacterium]|nr:hypothetical protein [Planctomycetota bacterium]